MFTVCLTSDFIQTAGCMLFIVSIFQSKHCSPEMFNRERMAGEKEFREIVTASRATLRQPAPTGAVVVDAQPPPQSGSGILLRCRAG